MATIITDAFTRADGTGLGANWTDLSNGWDIVTNRAGSRTASGMNVSIYTGAGWTGGANQWSEAVMVQIDPANDGGLCVRGSATAGGTYYFLSLKGLGSALLHEVQAAPAFSGVLSWTGTVNVSDLVRLNANGTTISVDVNGVQVATTTDATIATGNPGIAGYNNGLIVDTWAAGDFGAGSASLSPSASASPSASVSPSPSASKSPSASASPSSSVSASPSPAPGKRIRCAGSA